MLTSGSEPGGSSFKRSWFLYTLLCSVRNSPRLLELLETVVESSDHGVACITEWRILYHIINFSGISTRDTVAGAGSQINR